MHNNQQMDSANPYAAPNGETASEHVVVANPALPAQVTWCATALAWMAVLTAVISFACASVLIFFEGWPTSYSAAKTSGFPEAAYGLFQLIVAGTANQVRKGNSRQNAAALGIMSTIPFLTPLIVLGTPLGLTILIVLEWTRGKSPATTPSQD